MSIRVEHWRERVGSEQGPCQRKMGSMEGKPRQISPGGRRRKYEQVNRPINCRLNVVLRSPTSFGLGRNNGCFPSQGSQLPRALP